MEKYRETSEYNREKLIWMWLAIIGLIAWTAFEIKNILTGKLNIVAIAYILLFSGLLIWRYAISYTYALTKDELIIHSKILNFSKKVVIPFDTVENYSDQYVKKFFRRTGISSYSYRYSSGDGNSTRILLLRKNGKKRAVLVKVSDKFMQQLQRLMPEKYLDIRQYH